MQTDRKTANEDEGDEMEKVRGSNKAEWRQCEGETFRNIPKLNWLCRGRAGASAVHGGMVE